MEFDNSFKKILDIEKELNNIFSIVTSEKEISSYKSMLLSMKLNILKDILDNIILSLMQESIINIYNTLKYQKVNFILFIVAFVLLFINPTVGLSLNLFSWFLKFKLDKKMFEAKNDMHRVEEINEKTRLMSITFDNCNRFLNARTNVMLESREDEINDIELKKIELGNETIQIAIMGGFKDNIPVELQEVVKNILQDDLKTDEEDIDKLIQMAGEKLSGESTKNNEQTIEICEKLTRKNKK